MRLRRLRRGKLRGYSDGKADRWPHARVETRAARTTELKEIADFARELNVDVVGIHLGFVPHETSDPDYRDDASISRATFAITANAIAKRSTLETGQEPVDVLIEFLDDVERDNIFVNFDPANMILYGAGEPIPALEKLGSRVRSMHCKDATWSDKPGETWGREVPLGEGTSTWKRF